MKNDRVLLVDLMNLAFRYRTRTRTNFASNLLNDIESFSCSSGFYCNKIIIAMDKGKSAYRTSIYPDYKGNREEKYKNQSEKERQEFFQFINETVRTLGLASALGYKTFRFQNVEADDIIAYIINTSSYEEAIILSTDADYDQLISEKVKRFAYTKKEFITLDNWPYDVSPDLFLDLKILQGDKGDNIPGIEGIGAKRGSALLNKFGLANILKNLPLPGKAKYIQNLNNNLEEIYLRNEELMDLRFLATNIKALNGNNSLIDKELESYL